MAIEAEIKGNLFKVGDWVKVTQTSFEGEKEKSTSFEGRVISIKGRGENKMFTVRRIGIDSIGVEKIFPLFSPTITKIILKKKANVRRAKLYYLRKNIH